MTPLSLFLQAPNTVSFIRVVKEYYNIAKAIGHHFDSIGITYDLDMSQDASVSYYTMKSCVADRMAFEMFAEKDNVNYNIKVS